MTKPRPYLSNDHLHDVITAEVGSIKVHPQEADRITYDVAHSNSMPANEPTSRNGSTVLDIGRGVKVRATGSVHLQPDGSWKVPMRYSAPDIHGSVYPSGRDLTESMRERAATIIERVIGDWAATHSRDIAQADDIYRNNGARSLEESIARHEAALEILRAELTACEDGREFTQYPDLPTKR
jgi:hypothetical protein